nr:hypothetical protein [Candidatus Levybacteria bacterium]
MQKSVKISIMPDVALASPLHDPKGLIVPILKKNGGKLKEIYSSNIAINVTSQTSIETKKLLLELGFNIQISKDGSIGKDYRNAIALALSLNTSFIHLLDFDRALHWADNFFDELKKVEEQMVNYLGYICFVRSKKAFESHPITQRSTETAVNAIASEVAGLGVDIMSGSLGIERKLAKFIVKESKREDFGFYAEPLIIAKKHNFPINIIEVDGLEWETPDQYKEQIEKYGYSGWLTKFQSLSEWEKRVKLLDETTQVLSV